MSESNAMRERIIDAARRLVQGRGYDGFSYADVAEAVGIRKASIHHHFPTKADLVVTLVERFRADCRGAFEAIDREQGSPRARLSAYARLFESTLADGAQMCLCGMLAAGQVTLPESARGPLALAIRDHETWLAGVLRDGQEAGQFRPDVPPARLARTIFASLEGAMLLARAHDDPLPRFRSVAATLLSGFHVEPEPVA